MKPVTRRTGSRVFYVGKESNWEATSIPWLERQQSAPMHVDWSETTQPTEHLRRQDFGCVGQIMGQGAELTDAGVFSKICKKFS